MVITGKQVIVFLLSRDDWQSSKPQKTTPPHKTISGSTPQIAYSRQKQFCSYGFVTEKTQNSNREPANAKFFVCPDEEMWLFLKVKCNRAADRPEHHHFLCKQYNAKSGVSHLHTPEVGLGKLHFRERKLPFQPGWTGKTEKGAVRHLHNFM